MSRATLWYEEAQTSGKQGPHHLWEGKEKQAASTERINGPDGSPGKDEVDETVSEGSNESLPLRGTGLPEDGAGVESDDVDYL